MISRIALALPVAVLLAVSPAVSDDDTEVTHLTDDSSDRKPLQTMVPIYPERARRQRLEGEVEVCFNVDREGRTSRIAVRRSTHRLFEKPARLAVRASTYHPLPEGKKPSGIKTCRTFRFHLTPVAIERPQ
ncbi:MAG: energy transducer TonB [Gammaproteobacteria bacterium]|nr:energy transducer TonB [Gammaproteobacteria bacterium]